MVGVFVVGGKRGGYSMSCWMVVVVAERSGRMRLVWGRRVFGFGRMVGVGMLDSDRSVGRDMYSGLARPNVGWKWVVYTYSVVRSSSLVLVDAGRFYRPRAWGSSLVEGLGRSCIED